MSHFWASGCSFNIDLEEVACNCALLCIVLCSRRKNFKMQYKVRLISNKRLNRGQIYSFTEDLRVYPSKWLVLAMYLQMTSDTIDELMTIIGLGNTNMNTCTSELMCCTLFAFLDNIACFSHKTLAHVYALIYNMFYCWLLVASHCLVPEKMDLAQFFFFVAATI